VFSTPSAI